MEKRIGKQDWRKFPVHAVTDEHVARRSSFISSAEEAASTGIAAINCRGHGVDGKHLYRLASSLRKITASHGVPLIVAARIDIALAAGADAVQLGALGVPLDEAAEFCRRRGLAFGYSSHSVAEAVDAEKAGAAYVYLGTVFSSQSKPGVSPAGTGLLAEVCAAVAIPVFAIGGMDSSNAEEAAAAGASGVAAITSIWNAVKIPSTVGRMAARFNTSTHK